MNSTVQNVVILGGGPVAWLAAAAIHRAFRHRGVGITVVDNGASGDSAIGRWTLPSQRGMHALIGVKEVEFLRSTGATFKLATEHRGWQGAASRFLHAHGDIGWDLGASGVPFYKYLQVQQLGGHRESPESYSLAATAAKLGRFARPMGDSKALTSSFTYAFHLEDAAYAAFLRQHVTTLGVSVVSATLTDVSLSPSGEISAVTLSDGRQIGGDLFVDCSGPDAMLMSRVASGARDDWSATLPCDRMWSARAKATVDPPAMTVTTAASSGWLWKAPLSESTMVGHTFSSAHMSEEAALARLQEFAPDLTGTPVLNRFSSGRRRQFWERNCVALGATAVEIETLAGANLHLAQLGIATLIELFPLEPRSSVEAVEYNRVMAEQADAVRDFTLAHYRIGSAPAGDFWSEVRAAELPARLTEKLELYAANGRIGLLDFDSFEEVDWAWLLIGAGMTPDAIELRIRAELEKIAPNEVATVRNMMERLVSSMPRHIDYVKGQKPKASNAPRP